MNPTTDYFQPLFLALTILAALAAFAIAAAL
jgi:hypothetical protein